MVVDLLLQIIFQVSKTRKYKKVLTYLLKMSKIYASNGRNKATIRIKKYNKKGCED